MFHFVRKEVIDMADSKVEYPAPDCLAPAAIEAKTGISVFDDDFGLHAQQVAFLMKFRDLVERVRDVSGVYLTGRLQ